MFHLIIKASCSGEYADPQPDYVILQINQQDVQALIDKITRVKRFHEEEDDDVYHISYWDCRPTWVAHLPWDQDGGVVKPSEDDDEDDEEDLEDEEVEEVVIGDWPIDIITGTNLGERVEANEFVYALIAGDLPDRLPHEVRDEIVTLDVGKENLCWEGVIKHTDERISTSCVDLEDWQKVLEVMHAHGPQWSKEDDAAANKQGWNIFTHDTEGYQLQKIDCPEDVEATRIFATDDEAANFVQQQANAGDPLAQKAIAFLVSQGSEDVDRFHLALPARTTT